MARPAAGRCKGSGAPLAAGPLTFLAVLGSHLCPAASQAADPPFCAFQIVDSLDSIVNAAYDIIQAATDCTLPNFVELSCAADLTDMMSWWSYCANDISGATWSCGSLSNTCAEGITLAFASSADTSNSLVAAASDCVSDPFICTYDVVTAVDGMNNMIAAIIGAVTGCRGDDVPFFLSDFSSNTLAFRLGGGGDDDGGYYERRLSQSSTEESRGLSQLAPGSSFEEKLEAIRQRAQKVHETYAAQSSAYLSSDDNGERQRLQQETFHKLRMGVNTTEKASALSSLMQAFKRGPLGEMAASKTAQEAKQRIEASMPLPAGSLLV